MAISKEFMRHFGIIGLRILFPDADEGELNKMQDKFEKRRDAGMPKDGQFYSTNTLLGCNPDRNKRFVYCWPCDRPVLVMNYSMGLWTESDEDRLQAVLSALNDQAKKSTVLGSLGMTGIINVPGLNEVLEKGKEAVVHISKDRVASMVASGAMFDFDSTMLLNGRIVIKVL
jgi:hypothetical protein